MGADLFDHAGRDQAGRTVTEERAPMDDERVDSTRPVDAWRSYNRARGQF